MHGRCSVPVICTMDSHLVNVNVGGSLDGGKDGVIKDSASSTVSGEIGMQPYIRRSGTDDSGCAHIFCCQKANSGCVQYVAVVFLAPCSPASVGNLAC